MDDLPFRARRVVMLLRKDLALDPRVRKEATTLARAGHHVTVMHVPSDAGVAMPRSLVDAGVKTVALPSPKGGHPALHILRFRRDVDRARRRLGLRPDVLHAHDLDGLMAALPWKRSCGDACTLVYDAHEFFPELTAAHSGRLAGAVAGRFERRALQAVDALITVHEPMVEAFGALVDVPILGLLNCPERIDAPDRPPTDGASVFYGGTLTKERMFPNVVSWMADAPDHRLIVAGVPGPEFASTRAAAAAQENVDFVGTLTQAAVMDATLDAGAVLCMFDPTDFMHRVGCPNKLFEAMACGRPVIASDGTWTGAFVREHDLGPVVPHGKTGFLQALDALTPGAMERWGRNGRHLAEGTYNWDAQEEALKAFYAALPGPSSSP